MGRPRKQIDKKQFENLCGLQCTLEEICGWFDVCTDTLETWCKREYKKNFYEVLAQAASFTGRVGNTEREQNA